VGERKTLGRRPLLRKEGVSSPNPTSTKNLSHGVCRFFGTPRGKGFCFLGALEGQRKNERFVMSFRLLRSPKSAQESKRERSEKIGTLPDITFYLLKSETIANKTAPAKAINEISARKCDCIYFPFAKPSGRSVPRAVAPCGAGIKRGKIIPLAILFVQVERISHVGKLERVGRGGFRFPPTISYKPSRLGV